MLRIKAFLRNKTLPGKQRHSLELRVLESFKGALHITRLPDKEIEAWFYSYLRGIISRIFPTIEIWNIHLQDILINRNRERAYPYIIARATIVIISDNVDIVWKIAHWLDPHMDLMSDHYGVTLVDGKTENEQS
jgi:hypothetical protein